MIRKVLAAAALAAVVAAPAWAGSCPKDMKAIDEALAKNPSLSADQMSKVKMLRAQGEEEHKSGKHAESVKTLGQAKQMLGIKNM